MLEFVFSLEVKVAETISYASTVLFTFTFTIVI